MKRRRLLQALLSLAVGVPAWAQSAEEVRPARPAGPRHEPPPAPPGPELHPRDIRVTIGGHATIAHLIDNPSARDLFAMLPLRLTLEDRASISKTAALPKTLTARGAPAGVDPDAGDLAYHAPSGRLVIFYRDAGYASGLVKLGRFAAGAAAFDVQGPIDVTIEAVR